MVFRLVRDFPKNMLKIEPIKLLLKPLYPIHFSFLVTFVFYKNVFILHFIHLSLSKQLIQFSEHFKHFFYSLSK